MKLITGISSSPNQTFQTQLSDGSFVYFQLFFKPRASFFFLNLTYKTKTINGIKLAVCPNLLEQFTNILPFGILISVTDGTEPILIDDFVTGRASFNILEVDDLAAIKQAYEGTT